MPIYANASFATYEETFLPMFSSFLLLYKRYIDDILGFWICHLDPVVDEQMFAAFKSSHNGWTGLTWDVSPLSTSAVFLDITITIENNTITTNLYEKTLNKHLYLPARSAHPLGVLHGLIAGHIYRAKALCTDPADARISIQKMYRYLRARGYANTTLQPIFLKALSLQSNTSLNRPILHNNNDNNSMDSNHWLFKLDYHPQDPPSALLRKAWDTTVANPFCGKPLERFDVKYRPIGARRFIVCYRRGKNLGNLLSYRKLRQHAGPNVSSFLD